MVESDTNVNTASCHKSLQSPKSLQATKSPTLISPAVQSNHGSHIGIVSAEQARKC